MKKIFTYLAFVVGALIMAIAGVLTYVSFALPDVGPAPQLTVKRTAERVERGRYLANHVMLCMDCHSTRDWSLFAGPMVTGTEGRGGEVFDQKLGFPGRYVAPNITPYHLSDWTDGEIFRAVTSGVAKDGRALFPVMPHHLYGQLDKSDIESVIAYVRTLKPIANTPEKSHSDFPMNFIINTIPKKAGLVTMPSTSDAVAYGNYIVTASACGECHTRQEKGHVVGEPFAGGFEFPLPNGSVVRSANITPDKETGIGNWTREQFVRRFKAYADSTYTHPKAGSMPYQSTMPWTMYAGMKTSDLEAAFAYLHSIKAVKNTVIKGGR